MMIHGFEMPSQSFYLLVSGQIIWSWTPIWKVIVDIEMMMFNWPISPLVSEHVNSIWIFDELLDNNVNQRNVFGSLKVDMHCTTDWCAQSTTLCTMIHTVHITMQCTVQSINCNTLHTTMQCTVHSAVLWGGSWLFRVMGHSGSPTHTASARLPLLHPHHHHSL